MSIEAMKQMVEALEIAAEGGGVDFYAYVKEGRQAIAEAENDEPVGWIDNKGNMICTKINESCKPLYTHPQPAQPKREPLTDEPVAKVTGVYGGRFVVEPLNPAMVLPVNMALYTHPQPRKE